MINGNVNGVKKLCSMLINRGGIQVHMERLICEGEQVGFPCLGFDAQVKVPGVMPSAAVEAGHALPGAEARQGIRALEVPVKMVPGDRGHPGIVHMASSVPDAVVFTDAHMAHLHGQEIFQDGLPDPAVKDVWSNAKDAGDGGGAGDLVKAGLSDGRKIKAQIPVTQEGAPVLTGKRQDFFFFPSGKAPERHVRAFRLPAVELHDGGLDLAGEIPDLGDLNGRRAPPALHDMRGEDPLGGMRIAICQRGGEDKPPVIVADAAVHEAEVRAEALHGQREKRVLGGERKDTADGIRGRSFLIRAQRAVSTALFHEPVGIIRAKARFRPYAARIEGFAAQNRPGRLAGEEALRVIHDPALPDFRKARAGLDLEFTLRSRIMETQLAGLSCQANTGDAVPRDKEEHP